MLAGPVARLRGEAPKDRDVKEEVETVKAHVTWIEAAVCGGPAAASSMSIANLRVL
jgi:hypothetical protein